MTHFIRFTTVSALAVVAAGMVAAQDAPWAPGDFGSTATNWAESPQLARQMATFPHAEAQTLAAGLDPEEVDPWWTQVPPSNEVLDSPDVPRTEDGLPDIFGEWEFHWARIGPQQADGERYLSAEEGHRLLPEDFVSDVRFQEWETRSLTEIPTNNCVPHHAPRIAMRASMLEITRSAPSALVEKVIFLHEQFNVIRKAYLSYHPEPDMAARPTWGTTIGEWVDRSGDGTVDTFVMVTEGFVGSWVDQTGVVYETGAVLTEEYWLNEDGSVMHQHWILEDPSTYAHPIHHHQWFTRVTDEEAAVYDEYVCNLESARPEMILERYQNAAAPASN